MDIETAEALETLRVDIHRIETSLTSEMRAGDGSLRTEIGRVETSLTSEIHRVETSLTSEIRRVETSLTSRIDDRYDDSKRHTDVLFESLRDDIRMVAEAVVALGAKVDARHP
jgi:hypothetical protein